MKLSVVVEEPELDEAIDAAFRKIAREVRIPGFRPGKAPRKVLEARLGRGIGRTKAIEDALPGYYVDAVKEHEVDVIGAPEIDITSGQEEGEIAFDAIVEVRPEVIVPGYQSLRVTVAPPIPTDEEVDEQIEKLRERFSSLESVSRPAVDGDVVVIDISGTQDGEQLEGLAADDYSYEVGSNSVAPQADENLRGAKVGEILSFEVNPSPAGEDSDDEPAPVRPIQFRILVKDVQAKVLPELDDAFADEASEFETLDALRVGTRERLDSIKRMRGAMELSQQVGEALADLVEDEIPTPLIEHEMRQKLQDLALRLASQGIELGQWLEMTGQSQQDLIGELRGPAEVSARVDLALRAIADAQGIDCTDDELEAEYATVAERVGSKPAEVRRRLEREGEVQAVRSDVKKRKAFEWLLEQVEVVDPEGNPLDRSLFKPVERDEVDSDQENGQENDQPQEGEQDPEAIAAA